jgi:hypothetical protein
MIEAELPRETVRANQGSPTARDADNRLGFNGEQLAISPEIGGSGSNAVLRERLGNGGVIVVDLKGSKALLTSRLEAGGVLFAAFAAA